jgi:hypothetical protein
VRRAGRRGGKLDGVSRVFASLSAFIAADARREGGDHLELGGWWRAVEGPIYSAAWAPGSGELYLVSHETGRVRVIGEPMDRAEVVRRLDGWPGVVGRRASVEWLLAQAAPRKNRAAAGGIGSSGRSVCVWPSSLKRTLTRPALVS